MLMNGTMTLHVQKNYMKVGLHLDSFRFEYGLDTKINT